jgi:hypothetical protein
MIDDDLTIPSCLLLSQSERAAAWKGKRLTRQGSHFLKPSNKVEEAATRRLRKEIAQQETAKREMRFARLRELRERSKR